MGVATARPLRERHAKDWMLQVFKIEGALQEKYRGAGHALAVAKDGELLDFKYLREIHDDFDVESDEELEPSLGDPRLSPTIYDMSKRGEVLIGMCSCLEFVVL